MGENSWNGYERNCLFASQDGSGRFVEVARALGGDEIGDSRGVAVADFNDDGRLDLAINNNHGLPALYLNRIGSAERSLRLRLEGSLMAPNPSNLDAVGARVELQLLSPDGDRKTSTRWVEAGSGFASQSSFELHFGLGTAWRVDSLRVVWPSGRRDDFSAVDLPDVNRLEIVEGLGIVQTSNIAQPPATALTH